MTGPQKHLHEFTALELRDYLAGGSLSVREFAERQLAFVSAAEDSIHAFESLDERVIRLQADHLDASRQRGDIPGPLFGVPVAVKDIIDTIDFPTSFGSPIHQGRYAIADASVVRRLREAGALIFGKSTTTEFASFTPTQTRNPHNLHHTPGGSSSGSAAAVAAGMVPLALGSQTNGSVIRPASFCGVYAYKPSRGLVPRSGVLDQSPTLDQLGVFARNLEDLALAGELLIGDDGSDNSTRGVPPRRLMETCLSAPPVGPRFAFVRTPWWGQISEEAREACEAFVSFMPDIVSIVDLPGVVESAVTWHNTINEAELSLCLQREYRNHRDQLSPALVERIERGATIPVLDYLLARERIDHVTRAFDEYFEHFDAILTPAALGAAPEGLAHTGNPIMQTVWTYAGLPSLNLPLITLSNNMPFGIQAIGAAGNDGRLLRSARWLVQQFIARNET